MSVSANTRDTGPWNTPALDGAMRGTHWANGAALSNVTPAPLSRRILEQAYKFGRWGEEKPESGGGSIKKTTGREADARE